MASYWEGGDITLVSSTFNPTLEFAKKFAKFTVKCSTCCCVVGREGVERDNLAINAMSNGGTTTEAVYDVTVRVRCSRALRVTSITGPGITRAEKAPFMPKDGSLLLQYGETPRMAIESLEDDMLSAFTIPKCSLDASFNINLEFDFRDSEASNSYQKVELPGIAMFQATIVYTDSSNNRIMRVASRSWDATMDAGLVARNLSFLGWLGAVSSIAVEGLSGDASASSTDAARKAVRNYAAEFFRRFQSNANAAHALACAPTGCLGLEKSPAFRGDVPVAVRSRYLQVLRGGVEWVAKVAIPVLIDLSSDDSGLGFWWEKRAPRASPSCGVARCCAEA